MLLQLDATFQLVPEPVLSHVNVADWAGVQKDDAMANDSSSHERRNVGEETAFAKVGFMGGH